VAAPEVLEAARESAKQLERQGRDMLRQTGVVPRGPPSRPTGVEVLEQRHAFQVLGADFQGLDSIRSAAGVEIHVDQSTCGSGYCLVNIYGPEDGAELAKTLLSTKIEHSSKPLPAPPPPRRPLPPGPVAPGAVSAGVAAAAAQESNGRRSLLSSICPEMDAMEEYDPFSADAPGETEDPGATKGKGRDNWVERCECLICNPGPDAPGFVPCVDDSGQQVYGLVARFNPAKGFGFIRSAEAKQRFGRDVFLHWAQFQGFEVGAHVAFTVQLNKDQMPQARNLRMLSEAECEALKVPFHVLGAQSTR